jgi:thymidylate synthase ThyX
VLVGYGDDSVAQLGGAHIACENISNVAAKLLEDARIGIAPLEKSTRYVRFDQKDQAGNYLFYREPKIMASRHRDAYLETMNLLFDTYSRQMEPMLASIAKALPIEQLEVRDPASGNLLSYAEAQKDERLATLGRDRLSRHGARARLRRVAQLSAGGDADQCRHVRRRPGLRVFDQQVLLARSERRSRSWPPPCTAS